MIRKKIVITGMGVVSPIGLGLDNYWNSLISGISGVDRIDVFDTSEYSCQIAAQVKNFDPNNFIEDKKKIKKMDRFVHFVMAATEMAIKDANLNFQNLDKTRIGVIIGSGIGGLNVIENQHSILLEKGPKKISPFFIPMLITNIASGEIAIQHGLKGPNFAVSSACASSNHAIGESLRLLRYGDADMIITGGTEAVITQLGIAGFCSLKALSTQNNNPSKASRPFDKNRDGFVMGEGAGVLILETLEHAKKRDAKIYAELSGYGASDDAYHITAPDPEAEAAINCVKAALNDSGFSINDVDYINAHGTSTYFNDKTETTVFKSVFGERAYKIPISSTKSMIGHLLGAAGAIELIASVMSIKTGIIHPTINYEVPDPECDLDYVPNIKRENQKVNVAISNSLGFGGHNSTLVINKLIE